MKIPTQWPMEGSNAWWPLEGFNAWWPMQGERKVIFHIFPFSHACMHDLIHDG